MAAFLDAEDTMVAHDGARLGLSCWHAAGGQQPAHVIVGVHGMNNYAGEFRLAAPEWAAQGRAVYAYDQRGFGRSAGQGRWAGDALMQEDLRTATALAKARHPGATLTVIGISMGAAVAVTAFASKVPPVADRLILSGPGLRGWGTFDAASANTLKLLLSISPGLKVSAPSFLKPKLSDNADFIRLQESDPLHSRVNRIDQIAGALTLMEEAHEVVSRLPAGLPVLASYGAHDRVVPPSGPRRTLKRFRQNVRTVYYPDGYHVLLSDQQRAKVIADYAAFMDNPEADLPSGCGAWPFR